MVRNCPPCQLDVFYVSGGRGQWLSLFILQGMTQVIQEQQRRQLFRERAQYRAPRDGSSTLEMAGERGPFASVSPIPRI